jgi:predicted nucleotidyltransferase
MERTQIQSILERLEEQENVRILYACESGSRAWGFPSADSDYDIRFIYVRPRDWYLSVDLEHRRDVIERPIQGAVDLSGWDLRKALGLFRKSNPPLLEWLNSPIVYLESTSAAARLRALLGECYSPLACAHHYLHMARGNFREYLSGSEVWVKKYFYVLRPLLAVKWIEAGHGVAPMALSVLVDRIITDPDLKDAIASLVEAKRRGDELDRGPMIPAITAFIEQEMARLETSPLSLPGAAPPIEPLNKLFRSVLEEAWTVPRE